MEVINPDHPRAEKLRRTLEMPHGYNVRQDRDVTESREFWQSITMSPGVFRTYAEGVGLALDALTEKVLGNDEFRRIEHVWEKSDGGATGVPNVRARSGGTIRVSTTTQLYLAEHPG